MPLLCPYKCDEREKLKYFDLNALLRVQLQTA